MSDIFSRDAFVGYSGSDGIMSANQPVPGWVYDAIYNLYFDTEERKAEYRRTHSPRYPVLVTEPLSEVDNQYLKEDLER